MKQLRKSIVLSLYLLIFFDLKIYSQNSVTIGKQIWTLYNAQIDTFNNGDKIPQANSYLDWEKAGKDHKPAWCYQYLNEATRSSVGVDTCGKLYNWYAITDKRGFAPKGWHVPSKAEFLILLEELGGAKMAGNKLRVDKDSSGFRAFAVGHRFANGDNDHKNGFSKITTEDRMENHSDNYYEFDVCASFWSSSSVSNYNAFSINLSFINSTIYFQEFDRGNGRSVRFIKD